MTKQNNAINIRMQHTLTLYSADRDEAEINYDLCYSLTLSQFEMSSFDWFQGIFPLQISIKLKCLYSRLSLSSVCHHYRHYVIIVIIMSRSCYIAIGRYFMFSIIMSWPGENNDKSAQLACVLELFFVLWLCVSFNLYFYIRRAPFLRGFRCRLCLAKATRSISVRRARNKTSGTQGNVRTIWHTNTLPNSLWDIVTFTFVYEGASRRVAFSTFVFRFDQFINMVK